MKEDPEAPFSMRRGAVVSGFLHLSLVAIALFGGQLFESDEAQKIQFAEVDLISGAEFDAALSSAPKAPREDLKALQAPQFAQDSKVDPNADAKPDLVQTAEQETPPTPESRPNLAALAQVEPQGAVLLTAPKAPTTANEDAAPRGVSRMEAPAPVGPERLDAPLRPDREVVVDTSPPKQADRVAPEAAPKTDVLTKDVEAKPETAPSETAEAEKPVEETPAAPPEATTEIVTEADEPGKEEARAPIASAPPRGRPAAVVAAAETARKPEEPKPAEEVKTAEAAPAAETKPAPTEGERQPRRATDAPLGAKLTSGEIEGLRIGLSKFWRIDRVTNLPNYEELVVVMRVNLDQGGRIIGAPEPVSPASATDGRFKIAIDVARIALQRAEPFPLPPEKYGRWKTIEVTFNPKNKGVYF